MSINELKKDLKKLASPTKAKTFARFFKTGKGEYGEGDIFLGLTTPQVRTIVKKYKDLSLKELEQLLHSKIHEHRSVSLSILVNQYQKVDKDLKKKIYFVYLKNTDFINNWDLVDISAPKIVGDYLLDKKNERKILYKFARSFHLRKKRIAIISTFTFIKQREFDDTLKISKILLQDKHDLIHKAAGWMLREVGKIDQKTEEIFLKKYCKIMPRTMLRYAIEKFSPAKRKFYMKK